MSSQCFQLFEKQKLDVEKLSCIQEKKKVEDMGMIPYANLSR